MGALCTCATAVAAELRTACAANRTQAVAAGAHKLKPSAQAVGAVVLTALVAAMEEKGNAGDGNALAALLPHFEAEMATVEAWLDRL